MRRGGLPGQGGQREVMWLCQSGQATLPEPLLSAAASAAPGAGLGLQRLWLLRMRTGVCGRLRAALGLRRGRSGFVAPVGPGPRPSAPRPGPASSGHQAAGSLPCPGLPPKWGWGATEAEPPRHDTPPLRARTGCRGPLRTVVPPRDLAPRVREGHPGWIMVQGTCFQRTLPPAQCCGGAVGGGLFPVEAAGSAPASCRPDLPGSLSLEGRGAVCSPPQNGPQLTARLPGRGCG